MINEKLLLLYKNVNQLGERPLLKVLVSYIKPSFLFKSDVLTPIHLGRKVVTEVSKDGTLSDADLNWLYENCIGDDDFEGNISQVNRSVGFLTGTYWAWKNYGKLGNPEYFGSFGYRRLFIPNFLKKLQNYDMILPKKDIQNPNLQEFFINSHGQKAYRAMKNSVSKLYPNMLADFDNYMSANTGYMFEIYILKKDLFFNFCQWIFPLLFDILKTDISFLMPQGAEKDKIICFFADTHGEDFCNTNNFELYQKRSVGFIMERLTGFYLEKLSKQYTFYEEDVIQTLYPTQPQILNLLKLSIKG